MRLIHYKITFMELLLVSYLCCIQSIGSSIYAAQSGVPATRSLARLVGNVLAFSRDFPQEKVYLQFDNTGYYQGDIIWYKAFVVNATDNSRSPSHILYVELLSPQGEVVERSKLKIVAGQADGLFTLSRMKLDGSESVPLPSGYYEVRAYTMNMLNFGDDTVFSRVLPVYMRPSSDEARFTEPPEVGVDPVGAVTKRPVERKPAAVNASFHPEGGNPVAGVPCRLAFKVSGPDGLGLEAAVRCDWSDSTAHTAHDGMGVMTVVPVVGRGRATVVCDGREYHFTLPEAVVSGYTLSVANEGGMARAKATATGIGTDSVGVALTCRGVPLFFRAVAMTDGRADIDIPLDSMPEGVCHVLLFDHTGSVLASRSIYHRGASGRPSLTMTRHSHDIEPCDRVELRFTLKDAAGRPFRDRFCLSVRDQRSPDMVYSDDLSTMLLLSSDLKGLIYKPEYYFEADDTEHNGALDLLMMVQGWERYDWDVMSGTVPFNARHRIETGLTLNGNVVRADGSPVEGVKVLAAVVPPDKTLTGRYEMVTDESGYFGFDLPDFEGTGTLTIHTNLDNGRRGLFDNVRFLMERVSAPSPRAFRPGETQFGGTADIGGDDSASLMPVAVVNDLGVILPEVDISGTRNNDVMTFRNYDAFGDTELEYDFGRTSTDVAGYLEGKGHKLEFYETVRQDERKVPVLRDNLDVPDSVRSDTEMALWASGISHIDDSWAFWYVHDESECVYRGVMSPPWAIDVANVMNVAVYDRPVTPGFILGEAPLFVNTINRDKLPADMLLLMGYANDPKKEMRGYRVVDVLLKNSSQWKSPRETMQTGRRVTYVDGYSTGYRFYSPEYPDGPIEGEEDYRRTLYWNPNVITDDDGYAEVEFYNNSCSRHFSVSGAGITTSGAPYVLDAKF